MTKDIMYLLWVLITARKLNHHELTFKPRENASEMLYCDDNYQYFYGQPSHYTVYENFPSCKSHSNCRTN